MPPSQSQPVAASQTPAYAAFGNGNGNGAVKDSAVAAAGGR